MHPLGKLKILKTIASINKELKILNRKLKVYRGNNDAEAVILTKRRIDELEKSLEELKKKSGVGGVNVVSHKKVSV